MPAKNAEINSSNGGDGLRKTLTLKVREILHEDHAAGLVQHQFAVGRNERCALADRDDWVLAEFEEREGQVFLIPREGTRALLDDRTVSAPTLLPQEASVSFRAGRENLQFDLSTAADSISAPSEYRPSEEEKLIAQIESGLDELLDTLPSRVRRMVGLEFSRLEARLEVRLFRGRRKASFWDRTQWRHWAIAAFAAVAATLILGSVLLLHLPNVPTPLNLQLQKVDFESGQPVPEPEILGVTPTAEPELEWPPAYVTFPMPLAAILDEAVFEQSSGLMPKTLSETAFSLATYDLQDGEQNRTEVAPPSPKWPPQYSIRPAEETRPDNEGSLESPLVLLSAAKFERDWLATAEQNRTARRRKNVLASSRVEPPGQAPILQSITSHPVPIMPESNLGSPDVWKIPSLEKLKLTATPPPTTELLDQVFDRFLVQVRMTSLDVQVLPERLNELAPLLDAQVTDRLIPRESVATLLGLARQLDFLGMHPPTIRINLKGDEISRKDVFEALGLPVGTALGSIRKSDVSRLLHGSSAIPLSAVRLPELPQDGKLETRFLRILEDSAVPPDPTDVRWLNYGYLAIGFPAIDGDKSHAIALELSVAEFLSAHDRVGKSTVKTVREVNAFPQTSPIWSLALSASGQHALLGCWDGSVVLIDLTTGRELGRYKKHTKPVLAVALSRSESSLLSGANDRSARIWNTKTKALLQTIRMETRSPAALAISPDEKTFVVGDTGGMAILYDLHDYRELQWFMGHEGGITSVAFSPDGSRILTGSNDHTARIWDVETGQSVLCLRGHGCGVLAVAFSPDGTKVLTGSGGFLDPPGSERRLSLDHTVRLWNAKTGEELHRFVGHREWVSALAFSPDGTRIVSGSAKAPDGKGTKVPGGESEVIVWDAGTGMEILRFPPQPEVVRSVAFHLNDQIVTAGWDRNVRVWQLQTGQSRVTQPETPKR